MTAAAAAAEGSAGLALKGAGPPPYPSEGQASPLALSLRPPLHEPLQPPMSRKDALYALQASTASVHLCDIHCSGQECVQIETQVTTV